MSQETSVCLLIKNSQLSLICKMEKELDLGIALLDGVNTDEHLLGFK